MTKELEALNYVWYNYYTEELSQDEVEQIEKHLNIVQDGLKRLESIDNTTLSGALKVLEVLNNTISPLLEPILSEYEDDLSDKITANYFIVEQALLKGQELEKENEVLKGQVKYLTEVGTEYQKVFEIIKEKCVSIWHLMKSKTLEDYNSYLYIEGIEDTKIFILTQEEFNLLKRYLERKED